MNTLFIAVIDDSNHKWRHAGPIMESKPNRPVYYDDIFETNKSDYQLIRSHGRIGINHSTGESGVAELIEIALKHSL